ncbi:MAG: cupin domain-containing protein [Chloroflexi bacterium]|nr:cupin domain-containing protein [Chloroflexota bacterium]
MILHYEDARPVEMMPGVTRRTMISGDKIMVCEIIIEAGAVVPFHSHPHEQAGYVVSGEMEWLVGDDSYRVKSGDGYKVPGGMQHSARGVTRVIVVDTFSPPREEYK